jgi:hypothetical protein
MALDLGIFSTSFARGYIRSKFHVAAITDVWILLKAGNRRLLGWFLGRCTSSVLRVGRVSVATRRLSAGIDQLERFSWVETSWKDSAG